MKTMKNLWKIVIISIAAGVILFVIGFSGGAGQGVLYLSKSGIHVVSRDEVGITESELGVVRNIDIDADLSDVEFIPSDRYGLELCGYNDQWSWKLENETLYIDHNEDMWISFSMIGPNPQTGYVKIYLPRNVELGGVSVKTSSGEMNIGGFSAKDVEIDNSFGDIFLRGISCGSLKVGLSSGDFTGVGLTAQKLICNNSFGKGSFENVNAERLVLEFSSGNIELAGCVSKDIYIANSFGDVTATGLTSSGANISMSSGDITLDGEFSGMTDIMSSFGNVKLSTSKPKEYYSYDISISFGTVTLNNDRMETNSVFGGTGGSPNNLKINSSSGDVELYFDR